MRTPSELSDDLGDAICLTLADEGEFVNKWVAVAEVIDGEGNRWLRSFYPSDSATWDTLGMLSCARRDLTAAVWGTRDGD